MGGEPIHISDPGVRFRAPYGRLFDICSSIRLEWRSVPIPRGRYILLGGLNMNISTLSGLWVLGSIVFNSLGIIYIYYKFTDL